MYQRFFTRFAIFLIVLFLNINAGYCWFGEDWWDDLSKVADDGLRQVKDYCGKSVDFGQDCLGNVKEGTLSAADQTYGFISSANAKMFAYCQEKTGIPDICGIFSKMTMAPFDMYKNSIDNFKLTYAIGEEFAPKLYDLAKDPTNLDNWQKLWEIASGFRGYLVVETSDNVKTKFEQIFTAILVIDPLADPSSKTGPIKTVCVNPTNNGATFSFVYKVPKIDFTSSSWNGSRNMRDEIGRAHV